MISNQNSILVSLSVKFWTGFKYDKQASEQTLLDNNMSKNAGRFNKKLLPKHALHDMKQIINRFKIYFQDNTLPYNFLLGTRILPTNGYIDFTKEVRDTVAALDKAVEHFTGMYEELRENAKQDLGKLYRDKDYPAPEDLKSKFKIIVNYLPVPEADQFNSDVSNLQVKILNQQLKETSKLARAHLFDRAEQVVTSLHRAITGESKRVYYTTVTSNVNDLSSQLEKLNHNNDKGIAKLKKLIDDNIIGVKVDYIKDSVSYCKKMEQRTTILLQFIKDNK